MLIRVLVLAVLAVLLPRESADAQSARSVLLRLCNDAPFNVGIMTAYQTGASANRTLEGWFVVPAGECLEGGLDGVAGTQMGLHAFSGEWRWPAFDMGQSYCTPANGGRRPNADEPPCGNGEQAAFFQSATINRYRSGWGVVDFRISCLDFAGADRRLCETTPRARNGMAVPVRELEVCNYDQFTGRYAIGVDEAGGRFRVEGWQNIAPGSCETVYRGFPANQRVYIRMLAAEPTGRTNQADAFGDGRMICLNPSEPFSVVAPRPALVGARTCPGEAPEVARFQEIHYRDNVSRFTHAVHTLN